VSKERKPQFLAIELGSNLGNRSLSYVQLTTANLRNYELGFFPLPVLKVEFYPLALVTTGLMAGLGLEGGVGFAPFLKSRRQSTADTFPTSMTRIDAGLRWKLVPSKSFALALIPYVGLRVQSFTVGASATGDRLDGLPDSRFTSLRAGLAVELPVVRNLLLIVGRFGVLPVFSSGEILSAAYFSSGSAFGLEAAAGLAVEVLPFLQLRLTFEYSQYALTFKTQPTDTYVATGAVDRLLGGNASVRLQF
jgi:hypothetical protein